MLMQKNYTRKTKAIMLMQKMSTRKRMHMEAHSVADDRLGKENSVGAQNLSHDGQQKDDGSRCVCKDFSNRRRKGDMCSKREKTKSKCENNIENVEVNGMINLHFVPTGCMWAKPMDEKAKVKVLQPAEEEGTYSKRYYENSACDLGNDVYSNCKSVNDMTCDNGGLHCLKWGHDCYAGRVSVPKGFRVSGYNVKDGWWGDLCMGGKHKPEEVGHWTSGHFSFWNSRFRACAFKFEIVDGYFCGFNDVD